MKKKLFIWLIAALVPVLACSTNREADKLAVVEVSPEAETPAPVSSPTNLPIVEDVDRVKTETPQPTATPTVQPTTGSLVDSITLPEATENSGVAIGDAADAGDNDQENDKPEDNQTGNAITIQSTPTATPPPVPTLTATPSPSPTLTPMALVGGWPPVLPDAVDFNSGAGYAMYQTGTDAAAVADFYRREMAAQGWAEIDFEALVSELAQGVAGQGISPSGSVFDRDGTVLTFSQNGLQTLFFVNIVDNGNGQTRVELLWPPG